MASENPKFTSGFPRYGTQTVQNQWEPYSTSGRTAHESMPRATPGLATILYMGVTCTRAHASHGSLATRAALSAGARTVAVKGDDEDEIGKNAARR